MAVDLSEPESLELELESESLESESLELESLELESLESLESESEEEEEEESHLPSNALIQYTSLPMSCIKFGMS
jgi:hypothetical protein